ncbi:MAG: hypothetical protein K2I43_00920, partial [Alistipes sp.]|nr:hypothetical protein [Alistipes sp.]
MKTMKLAFGLLLAALLPAGCSSTYYASGGGYSDDMYATHDKAAIAKRQKEQADLRKAEAEARRAEWEARLAEAKAAAAEDSYYSSQAGVVADTYESAYARRLYGFNSPSYNMPSSYYNLRYSPVYNTVTSYDPAFYNIMVMGDQVWVEPKYITSMFGTWGQPSVSMSFYAGGLYNRWYYDWGYSPYYSWAWGY